MNYGFNDDQAPSSAKTETPAPTKTISLGTKRADERSVAPTPSDLNAVAEAGRAAGFVSRQPSRNRRRPGPKRTEPQGKITLTGPQRVLDRLQAYCDAMGGVAYWQGLEDLLDKAKD